MEVIYMKKISNYFLSNPLYWIFIVVGLVIIFVCTKYLSNILGWFGEHWVKEALGKLDKNVYIVLNDVINKKT